MVLCRLVRDSCSGVNLSPRRSGRRRVSSELQSRLTPALRSAKSKPLEADSGIHSRRRNRRRTRPISTRMVALLQPVPKTQSQDRTSHLFAIANDDHHRQEPSSDLQSFARARDEAMDTPHRTASIDADIRQLRTREPCIRTVSRTRQFVYFWRHEVSKNETRI